MRTGLDRLNCVAFFPCKRSRTFVGTAIGRHISTLPHHPPHLPRQPRSLRMQSTSVAALLIGLRGVRGGLSVPSGGPLSGRCSETHPALLFERGRVSENRRPSNSKSGLTGHEGRCALSQVDRRRTPKYTETRRDGQGSVASTRYPRAMA